MNPMSSPPRSQRAPFVLALAAILASCSRRSSLADLPLWRVEIEPNGREARVIQLPFELTAYDLTTHAVVRRVLDRNQDGISDRIVTYQGLGGARLEETDTDFDGVVDRWETFGPEGRRLRAATARSGDRPDQVATYDRAGLLSRVEVDSDLDGKFELTRVYEADRLVENRIDSDGNGRTDRVQEFRNGYMVFEDFDTDEDGDANLRMEYGKDGTLLKISVLPPAPPAAVRPNLR